jgi:hypothetical protein
MRFFGFMGTRMTAELRAIIPHPRDFVKKRYWRWRPESANVPRMNKETGPDVLALATAEEVLRKIYGDDLQGCTVTLDEIGRIIQQGAEPRGISELMDLYGKLVEAIHLLSTPPDRNVITDPTQLRDLLSQRLDAIHDLTTKALNTITVFKNVQKQ